MPYRVTLTEDAAADFRGLDGSLKQPVAKQLKKLETAPLLGEHLGNKAGLDLTGYYKLYVAKKTVRIVYRIIEQQIIVEVVPIDKREDLAVYQTTLKSNGLVRKSTAPSFIASTARPIVPNAVSTMTGGKGSCLFPATVATRR